MVKEEIDVNKYLNSLEGITHKVFNELRCLAKTALLEYKENMKYGFPVCDGIGKLGFAVRKNSPLLTGLRQECQVQSSLEEPYNCRGSAEINANILERAVRDKVSTAFTQPESVLEILRLRNEAAKQEAEVMRNELKAAEDQLTRKNLELQLCFPGQSRTFSR